MPNSTLHDIKLHVRFKLSALWTALMFCYIYVDYFVLYVPGKLEGMIAGEGPLGPVSEATMVVVALLLAIPGLMVFVSVIAPPRLCRWLNVILGIFYTLILAATMLMPGAMWFYIVLGVIEMALSLTIAIYAWCWPRELSYEVRSTT